MTSGTTAEENYVHGSGDTVERFFNDTNTAALRDWQEAVERVRAGQIDVDWLSKKPAETRLGIEVTEASRPAATNNELSEASLAA